MRVVMAGGGTGGHLYPLLSVAEELKASNKNCEIFFIGSERGIESSVVPREGYPIKTFEMEGFVDRPILSKLRAATKFLFTIKKVYRKMREWSPTVVVGSGGYVSVPPVVSAWLLGIPVVILEQNARAGLANRLMAHFARAVCISDQNSVRFFPQRKVFLTGNPVRRAFFETDRKRGLRTFSLKEGIFTVLILGGSRGATSINRAIVESLPFFRDLRENVQFLHQTGKADYEYVRDAYRREGLYGIVAPYIYQMPEAYAVADLVVCRAGASTITELCATARAAILVPYPYAAEDHQLRNAERLQSIGAGIIIKDHELSGRRIYQEIEKFLKEPHLAIEMGKRARGYVKEKSSEKVVRIIHTIIKERGSC